MIRVLVADDQAAVRDGFAALIDAQSEMTVVARAATGREAVDLARRTFPDVILMDIRMPTLDGLEATRIICADPTMEHTRVLILTTFDLDEYVYGALRAGASGFLLKDTPRAELLHAIEVIADGDALLAPSITVGSSQNSPPVTIRGNPHLDLPNSPTENATFCNSSHADSATPRSQGSS